MKKFTVSMAIAVAAFFAPLVQADVLTSIPGPDDQGGMIMPMVMLSGSTLSLMFTPPYLPQLASLDYWSPGDTFQPAATWYSRLDPIGGAGDLFNNQYGFTFMGSIPSGKALGIRLISATSSLFQTWNYVNSQNRFDEIFQNMGDQVLWNGSMWHSYFTLPPTASTGIYAASFEVFIANETFTAGTGFADYSAAALSAVQDISYGTVTINYSWQVVFGPERGLKRVQAWKIGKGGGRINSTDL